MKDEQEQKLDFKKLKMFIQKIIIANIDQNLWQGVWHRSQQP